MTESNQVITINNDKYLIRKNPTKLVLHHLPSLDIVHKHYSEVSYFCVNGLEIMLIYKNTLTFLKPKCPPLRLIEYQQQYLDWEPAGGLVMGSMVILYDKTTIAFYYRNPKLEKSWAIDVIQEIQQVKNSHDQKFIALKVKEPINTIFVWDMGNLSKKPNQQIVLKQTILKWIFYGENLLLIMTQTQFKVYFANQKTNQHFIQYYINLPQKYSSFLTLNQFNQTNMHSGRKSVNHVAFMLPDSCGFDVVELYDVEKRQSRFKHSQIRQLRFEQDKRLQFSQPIAGYENESKIHILAEVDTGIHSFEPKCLILNNNFQLEKITEYKQHQGIDLESIQYQNGYVFYLETKNRKYKLGKFVTDDGNNNAKENAERIKIFKEYSSEGIEAVYFTKNCVLFVNRDKKMAMDRLDEVQYSFEHKNPEKQLEFSVDFGKFNPKLSYYIFENSFSIFFVSGIRYFKYDCKKKQFLNTGFVLKNQRAKLHEICISTSSLVYKINEQFILIEYSNPLSQDEKMVFRTIKSSQNDKIISLRKNRWARVNLKEIVLGQGENELATFDLQKMFKTLLQQNSYFEYDLYWTTHGGMILVVKNYLFFLQITEGQNGSQIHLIKKGHSYLHRRFSSNIKSLSRIRVIDARHLVIYTGNRIVRLGNQVQSFVTENPYEIPDTLLSRQLQMRDYFSPHHPNVVNAMLENGWFGDIVKFMEKVYDWVQESQPSIKTLYQKIRIEDYFQKKVHTVDVEQRNEEEDLMLKKPEIRNQARDIELLTKICELILSQPQKLHLSQNNPLLLENLLRAVTFQLENTRSFDYFSQTVITKHQLLHNKNKSFTSIDVAFLLHSINKDQALEFLKGPDHKMDWQWVQKYSVALWYEPNVEKWRKWTEEIAMTQFRVNKDPFDSLFWYVLAGKKNLLVTLFKAQKFNSKEHDAMHTFLQRDFQDPKHRKAAVKNAYALIDKKRYMHAMAFLLLADKKQQCVRFAIERLNDMNLGHLIHLLSYTATKGDTNQVSKTMIEKGDVWAQHVGWVIEKKHLASYNVLLKEGNGVGWEYSPKLNGFHPVVVEFAQKIKESIPYKRELELKNNPVPQINPSLNFDHLNFDMDSFDMQPSTQTHNSHSINISITNQPKKPQFYADYQDILQQIPEEQQNGFKRLLNQNSVKHYMRHHLPCLALTLVSIEDNAKLYAEVQRAYELERYMLTGELSPSVLEIAQELDDIMGLLSNDVCLEDYDSFLKHLTDFRSKFQSFLSKIKINELNPPQKHQIGQILHYSYLSEKIFIQLEPVLKPHEAVRAELIQLSKTNNFGKVISGICLKVYSEMGKSLQAFKEKIFIQSNKDFWRVCKQNYDKLAFKKKEKHQKLMDSFELSLNKHIKKEKDDQHVDFSIMMPKSSTMSLLLWRKIFEFMAKSDSYMKEKILELKQRLEKIVKYWVEKEHIAEIQAEINILISQGVEYRLKLNVLSEEFREKELDTIQELLKLVYSTRELREIQEKKNSQEINVKSQHQRKEKDSQISKQQSSNSEDKEKSAVELFKNRTDPIRSFALNRNQGKGLEILVLFKKTMRKFEVADNLVNRDRSKEGNNLIHEDNVYLAESIDIPQEKLLLSKSHLPLIQETLKSLFDSRKLYDGQELIKRSEMYTQHISDYLKSAETTLQVDFNEIYSIESHFALPIYFLGGKGLIEVCRFDTAKSYNRIICPGLMEIVKIQSVGQRLYLLDKEGSFSCFIFDWTFMYKPIFEIKKLGIIDFTCSSPSQFGCITSNSFQYYDTLLHPKRQCVFKVQMSTPPVAVCCLSPTEFVILRKQQVQIYDISQGQLMESYNVQGRGRSLYVDMKQGQNYGGRIIVGRGDCKVKIIDLDKKTQSTMKVGNVQEQKDKVFIEVIKKFGHLYLCFRNDGSIYCFSV